MQIRIGPNGPRTRHRAPGERGPAKYDAKSDVLFPRFCATDLAGPPARLAASFAADPVVVKGGRVLTMRRNERPNRGSLAFPGGLIQPEETALDAARRELGEEVAMASWQLAPGAPVEFEPTIEAFYDDPERDPAPS